MVSAQTANLMLTASAGSEEETAATWKLPRPLSALLLAATAKVFPNSSLLGSYRSVLRSAAAGQPAVGLPDGVSSSAPSQAPALSHTTQFFFSICLESEIFGRTWIRSISFKQKTRHELMVLGNLL